MDSHKDKLRRRIEALGIALDDLQGESMYRNIPESLRMPLDQFIVLLMLRLRDVDLWLSLDVKTEQTLSLEEFEALVREYESRKQSKSG